MHRTPPFITPFAILSLIIILGASNVFENKVTHTHEGAPVRQTRVVNPNQNQTNNDPNSTNDKNNSDKNDSKDDSSDSSKATTSSDSNSDDSSNSKSTDSSTDQSKSQGDGSQGAQKSTGNQPNKSTDSGSNSKQ